MQIETILEEIFQYRNLHILQFERFPKNAGKSHESTQIQIVMTLLSVLINKMVWQLHNFGKNSAKYLYGDDATNFKFGHRCPVGCL